MFDFAEQAEILGQHAERLDALTKQLNTRMLGNATAANHIQRIIGAGRFNRAVLARPANPKETVAEATILYGDELIRARTQKDTPQNGMFAAFAAVHQPLLGFAQLIAVDLGNKGFTCRVTHDGHTFHVPLHELKTTFDDDGRICTTSQFDEKDRKGNKTGYILPAGFELSKEAGGNYLFHGDKDNMHCEIVDNYGKSCGFDLSASLLWVSIAGRGKNIFGKSSAKNGVLMRLGIDDMRVANMYLKETVTMLAEEHGYDAEPLWNRVMKSAREQLEPHLEALAITRESIVLAQAAKRANLIAPPLEPYYSAESIDDIVKFFGLTLPALDADKQRIAADVAASLTKVATR